MEKLKFVIGLLSVLLLLFYSCEKEIYIEESIDETPLNYTIQGDCFFTNACISTKNQISGRDEDQYVLLMQQYFIDHPGEKQAAETKYGIPIWDFLDHSLVEGGTLVKLPFVKEGNTYTEAILLILVDENDHLTFGEIERKKIKHYDKKNPLKSKQDVITQELALTLVLYYDSFIFDYVDCELSHILLTMQDNVRNTINTRDEICRGQWVPDINCYSFIVYDTDGSTVIGTHTECYTNYEWELVCSPGTVAEDLFPSGETEETDDTTPERPPRPGSDPCEDADCDEANEQIDPDETDPCKNAKQWGNLSAHASVLASLIPSTNYNYETVFNFSENNGNIIHVKIEGNEDQPYIEYNIPRGYPMLGSVHSHFRDSNGWYPGFSLTDIEQLGKWVVNNNMYNPNSFVMQVVSPTSLYGIQIVDLDLFMRFYESKLQNEAFKALLEINMQNNFENNKGTTIQSYEEAYEKAILDALGSSGLQLLKGNKNDFSQWRKIIPNYNILTGEITIINIDC